MVKQSFHDDFKDILELFENYFALLKAVRELANRIPDLGSKDEKIEAYKEYFRQLKRLREIEINVEDYVKVLSQI